MSHDSVGIPRFSEPPQQWTAKWAQEFIQTLLFWMRGTSAVSYEEISATNIRTITSSDLFGLSDGVVLVDATSASITVTFPAPASMLGMPLTIKRIDTTTNQVVLAGASCTIDGEVNYLLKRQNEAVTIRSNGTNYVITGAYAGGVLRNIIPTTGTLVITGINLSLNRIVPNTGNLVLTGQAPSTR